MATVSEENVINKIADIEGTISGVRNSFRYAENPTSLNNAQLPAVMHFQPQFESRLFAHHNLHRNEFTINSILYVAARQMSGGKLKFLENQAIPFLAKWRVAFQTSSNINSLLNLGLHKAYNFTGQYGAGGTLLTHNDIEYIGCIFTFNFVEIN
jgi:hypothetical protein